MVFFQKDIADSWGMHFCLFPQKTLGYIMRVDAGLGLLLYSSVCLRMEAYPGVYVGASTLAPQKATQRDWGPASLRKGNEVLLPYGAAGGTAVLAWRRALRALCRPARAICDKVIPRGTNAEKSWLWQGWDGRQTRPALQGTQSFGSVRVWCLWCKLCKLRPLPGHEQVACVCSDWWAPN